MWPAYFFVPKSTECYWDVNLILCPVTRSDKRGLKSLGPIQTATGEQVRDKYYVLNSMHCPTSTDQNVCVSFKILWKSKLHLCEGGSFSATADLQQWHSANFVSPFRVSYFVPKNTECYRDVNLILFKCFISVCPSIALLKATYADFYFLFFCV